MNKAFEFFLWENYTSINTPLNEQHLNRLNRAIEEIDNRVITHDMTKFNTVDAQGLIRSIEFNHENGVFTITYMNGAAATIDTMLEKLAVNFDFDETTQQLVITLDNGEVKRVDLSAFITPIEFADSGTIAFQLLDDGKVTAIVKEGSIEEKHLRLDYLAEIKVEAGRAETAGELAEKSAEAAKESETKAQAAAESARESETAAGTSATNAKESEEAARTSAGESKDSAAAAKQSAESAAASARKAKESAESIKESEENARKSADEAKKSEDIVKADADAAREAAEEAKKSETAAASSAASAEQNNTAAQEAKEAAETAATTATEAAASAAGSATAAAQSAQDAADSAASVKQSEINAAASAKAAGESELAAAKSEEAASDSALLSESFAHGGTGIREGEDTDNSEFYSKQSGKYLEKVEAAGNDALDTIDNALNGTTPKFIVHPENRHLYYKAGRFLFRVDKRGHLRWGVIA